MDVNCRSPFLGAAFLTPRMSLEFLQSASVALMLSGTVLATVGFYGPRGVAWYEQASAEKQRLSAERATDDRLERLQARLEALQTPPKMAPAANSEREDLAQSPIAFPVPVGSPDPPFPPPPLPTLSAVPAESDAPKKGYEFSPVQLEKMVQRLRSRAHGAVTIRAVKGNEEALGFARALQRLFVAAGWTTGAVEAVATEGNADDVVLSSGTFPPPAEVTTIFSALSAAGIPINTALDPNLPAQSVQLFVSAKP